MCLVHGGSSFYFTSDWTVRLYFCLFHFLHMRMIRTSLAREDIFSFFCCCISLKVFIKSLLMKSGDLNDSPFPLIKRTSRSSFVGTLLTNKERASERLFYVGRTMAAQSGSPAPFSLVPTLYGGPIPFLHENHVGCTI